VHLAGALAAQRIARINSLITRVTEFRLNTYNQIQKIQLVIFMFIKCGFLDKEIKEFSRV
jgi:hypothetical protein